MKTHGKRLVSLVIALLLAVIAEVYFAFTPYYLIFFATLCMFQFRGPKSLPRVLKRFLVLTVFLLLFLSVRRVFQPFPFIMSFYECMHDITLGAIIAVVVGWVVFPIHEDEMFRLSVIPILSAYSDYLTAIENLFLGNDEKKIKITQARQQAERMQLIHSPDWAYHIGFSPELRKGHKHFLIRLGQFSQILFSMNWPARHALNSDLVNEFAPPLTQCIMRMKNLMHALIIRLELKTPEKIAPDFSEDIHALQTIFHKIVPEPLALLDMSEEVIYLAAFIYSLKDLQRVMLKLAESLR